MSTINNSIFARSDSIFDEDFHCITASIAEDFPSQNEVAFGRLREAMVQTLSSSLPVVLTLYAGRILQADLRMIRQNAKLLHYLYISGLLHDSVLDSKNDVMRRLPAGLSGNNDNAVLWGDFVYSKVFQLMGRTGSVRICSLFSDTMNRFTEGRVMKLVAEKNRTITLEQCLQIIDASNALLLRTAVHLADAASQNGSEDVVEELENYASAAGRVEGLGRYIHDHELNLVNSNLYQLFCTYIEMESQNALRSLYQLEKISATRTEVAERVIVSQALKSEFANLA